MDNNRFALHMMLILTFVNIYSLYLRMDLKHTSFFSSSIKNETKNASLVGNGEMELPNVAIACAFNYKDDPQRNLTITDHEQYIHSWYTSIQANPAMYGVVLSNMYDEEFRTNYTTKQIQFIHIDPKTHPSFTNIPYSMNRSINDQVYFVVEWYLNQTRGQYGYALMTDMHDVTFQHNPFPFMKGIDDVVGKSLLYVQDEFKKTGNWIRKKWANCLNETRDYWSILYNSGIVGAESKHLQSFIHRMNQLLLQAPIEHTCDMAAFGKLIERDYLDNVIRGFPFHTKFKKTAEPGFTEFALIRHK